jgi:hypothetical protein
MAKSEGAEVRHAMNGPDIEHDALIGKIDKWNAEDRARASTAAETRGEIGQFTEQTGMNPKALSMVRTIKKAAAKDQHKGMDIIRSLETALPMIKADIGGQQSEMDLEPGEPEMVDPDEEIDEADLPAPSYQANFDPTGDAEIDAETDEFEDHLAQVAGDEA